LSQGQKVKDEVNSNLTVASEIYMIFVTKTLFPKKKKGERPFFFLCWRGKKILCYENELKNHN